MMTIKTAMNVGVFAGVEEGCGGVLAVKNGFVSPFGRGRSR